MYNEGDITRTMDLADPTSGRISQLFRKVSSLITRSTPDIMSEEFVIVTALLKVISHCFISRAFLLLFLFFLFPLAPVSV